jgi:4-hydroxy-tetrahydrodipicolinate reductase
LARNFYLGKIQALRQLIHQLQKIVTALKNLRIYPSSICIAHQEVIFGSAGQIYTLRHDTSDRACYMPGVLLAIRKVLLLKSLIYGLEKIL